MVRDALPDVRALPRTLTMDILTGLGWSINAKDDIFAISKGSLEVVFHRAPYGPNLSSSTLDLKYLLWRDGGNYLRYVDNESPYMKYVPCIDYWGGLKLVRSYTDEICTLLYDIALTIE